MQTGTVPGIFPVSTSMEVKATPYILLSEPYSLEGCNRHVLRIVIRLTPGGVRFSKDAEGLWFQPPCCLLSLLQIDFAS